MVPVARITCNQLSHAPVHKNKIISTHSNTETQQVKIYYAQYNNKNV